MPVRPNFTDVRLANGKVSVFGESNSDDLTDLVGIQIFVSQDAEAAGGSAQIATGFVAEAGSSWTAEFDAGGLVAGPAVAIGVETHREPVTAITWAQPIEITGE
jgi:hypothetical protein